MPLELPDELERCLLDASLRSFDACDCEPLLLLFLWLFLPKLLS